MPLTALAGPDQRDPIAHRFAAQLLSGPPADGALEVADRLLAVQAQDPRGARLAIRARTGGLRAADVDAALTDRSLVVSWLNRGTLHLVRAMDYWWLHTLVTPQLSTGNARRLAQEGVSPWAADRGVAVIERALAKDGPQTRAQLRERVRRAGVPVAGQALVHILVLASIRGLIVRGPLVGGEQAFVLVRDWLGRPPPVDREAALVSLAGRYLAGHGPATDRDLARWAGVPLSQARRGLRGLGGAVGEQADGHLQLVPSEVELPPMPPPRLLGAFDPVLLGWTSREPILGPHTSVVTTNGIFRPFALVDGRGVATWKLVGKRVVLEPLDPLEPNDAASLRADAADVERFLA